MAYRATQQEILNAIYRNRDIVEKAMDMALPIPAKYKPTAQENAVDLGELNYDTDDCGLPRLVGSTHFFYYVDEDDFVRFEFGENDNEIIISVDDNRRLVVIGY